MDDTQRSPSRRGWSVMDEPCFQAIREQARVAYCEKHGLPHDGDGWTVWDRPKNPKPPGFLNND